MSCRFVVAAWVAVGVTLALAAAPTQAADLSSRYRWQPVRIGGGGFVVGLVIHPRDSEVRYARTDVGEAYRWDRNAGEWRPMKIYSREAGMPPDTAVAPSPGGEQSIAVDPAATGTIYMACPTAHSSDVGGGTGINVYKSTDGGRHFAAGNLNVPGNPNDDWRTSGERLAVDPHNGRVLYFGTPWRDIYASPKVGSGLYRSLDGGVTWSQVTGEGAPSSDSNVINVLFDLHSAVTNALGITGLTSVVYAVTGDGDVYRSANCGRNWTNLTATMSLSGHTNMTTLASDGSLWVAQSGSKAVWKYAGGAWSTVVTETGGDNVHCVAVDPSDPTRVWALGNDGGTGLSTDGGAHWTAFGRLKFANTLGWMPQTVGSSIWYGTRSVATLQFDKTGTLWIAMGQEGTLHYTPMGHESAGDPPRWTIASKGIEELVAQDIVLPKGGDAALVAAQDATGFVIPHPDDFSATQIPLQNEFGLISQGTGAAASPNAPQYWAVTSSNVYMAGKNLSGFSSDGGKTWKAFGSALQYTDGGKSYDIQAGAIAVGRRAAPQPDGSDVHLVQLPMFGMAPVYSHDGGRTWNVTRSFPLAGNGMRLGDGYQGFWGLALKQRPLYADPFVADKFYLKLTHAPASLYISTDGGETWMPQNNAGLPDSTHHGQLAVNDAVRDDLWFADGWEGASEHGLWHSTDGGATFQKVGVFRHAVTLALGAGSRRPTEAAYSVYVYGQLTGDPAWGVFRSTDGGRHWDRIAYYPTGIYDQPTCMAASGHTFGKVWIGFAGNSFVYGTPLSPTPPTKPKRSVPRKRPRRA